MGLSNFLMSLLMANVWETLLKLHNMGPLKCWTSLTQGTTVSKKSATSWRVVLAWMWAPSLWMALLRSSYLITLTELKRLTNWQTFDKKKLIIKRLIHLYRTVQKYNFPNSPLFLPGRTTQVQSVSILFQQQQQWCVFRHVKVFRCSVHEQSRGARCTSVESFPWPNPANVQVILRHLYIFWFILYMFFA